MTQVTAFLSRERPLQDPMESGKLIGFGTTPAVLVGRIRSRVAPSTLALM